LFWRSGHYRSLRYGGMKLQVIEHPDRVFWFDLNTDPFEHINLAQRIGIETKSELDQISQVHMGTNQSQHFSSTRNHSIAYLIRLYGILNKEEQVHREPLWKPAFEAAIPIDKTSTQLLTDDDEYIYFVN
jgi:hypothetical protein